MKRLLQFILAPVLFLAAARPGLAITLLDDTFADGTRTVENLPTESAWYASSSSALTAAPGAMTLAMGSTAILAVSYYTTGVNSPVALNVGDALTVTITYTFNGIAAENSSQGFRFAACYFGTNRVSGDFTSNSSQGANVPGYGLFQNMGATFNNSSPTDIYKRTTLSDSSLLGSSGDWTSLGSGPGNTSGFTGFSSGVQYTLQLTLQRTAAGTMQITATWVNVGTGATLSTTETDASAANFSFDGLAIRPSGASSTATDIIFNEVRVDYTAAQSPPAISTQPVDQSIFVGQNATFSVGASGSAPLTYQWYYDNDTALADATNASLTIADAQVTNTGGYSVLVSNAYGSALSYNAQLAVSVPTAPSIATQPQSQTVSPGATAVFAVEADGSEPLTYQWYYNGSTALGSQTNESLTLSNVQPTNAGSYSVTVSNFAGFTNSAAAVLTVNTNSDPPGFTVQPASETVLIGGVASFSATATGAAPIYFQWLKNGSTLPGATSSTLTLTNVQTSDAGNYALLASNSVGAATSATAVLTVTPSIPVVNSAYNVVGFALPVTGGGALAETDPNYAHVYTATDLANALISKTVKVIEIMNDLNLGYNEIEASAKTNSEPFRSAETPLLHPVLLQTGVSDLDIQKKAGLTIFSANASTIRHAKFNIKSAGNIIIRNLKFDQLWEWDEDTKGQYDRNDWDFMTLGDGGAVSNIWVDHCTFTKSYDGIIDTKAGCSNITISWCHYTGDDGATNANSWVWQQINSLESNRTSYPMYNFLRTRGFTPSNIVYICLGHDKTHLAGQNDLDPDNATISMTFHHLWLNSVWDRCVPRLRAGNVHDYNLYVDDTQVLSAKNLRDSIAATMSAADQNTLNNTYDFDPPINGAISTESGALLLEKSVYIDCLWPLRNNQTDPSDPEYTGKILGLDTIYEMNGTIIRGNSTDPGNPMGPFQAPIIPFSWNLPGNQLPYSYTPDDPSQLEAIVTSPTAGAGAGILTWAKTNWLVTTYAPTAPFIVAQPQNLAVAPGGSATFTVVAGGSAALGYQWYFNTNTPLADATNSVFSLPTAQATNAGVYSVVVTNSAGSVASAFASLVVSSGAPPQASNLVYSNGVFSMTINGAPAQNYVIQASADLINWTPIFTNPAPTLPFVWSDPAAGEFLHRYYRIVTGP